MNFTYIIKKNKLLQVCKVFISSKDYRMNKIALINLDNLSVILIFLISYISLIVGCFASQYLQGDTQYYRFFTILIFLFISVVGMVSTDHILLLVLCLGLSNYLLVKLMVHKSSWKAAQASGRLASNNFFIGSVFFLVSFGLFYAATGQVSIKLINQQNEPNLLIFLALIFLVLGAMTQSAIWPFHRWLLSSLNSPTPVSAVMHAGLINGGGFLLIRFAPLLFKVSVLLEFIFAIGVITAVLGTLWKLMQSNVKGMLACSTMGQMGFMFVQCGLGLFPAAIAHLCWHSLFKAYLFLASNSAAQEKRLDLSYPPTKLRFCLAILCGLVASYCFNKIGYRPWFVTDTRLFITVFVLLAGCQMALPILNIHPVKSFPLALISTSIGGALYGLSVYSIESLIEPLRVMQPQPLNLFHVIAIALFIFLWLTLLFINRTSLDQSAPRWYLKFYVRSINYSQPNQATQTTHRNSYTYL